MLHYFLHFYTNPNEIQTWKSGLQSKSSIQSAINRLQQYFISILKYTLFFYQVKHKEKKDVDLTGEICLNHLSVIFFALSF